MEANETIAAISTPPGEGGIAVIRISGDNALSVADAIFSSKEPLPSVQSHTIHYGFIYDSRTAEKIDEVLVSVMLAPRTFTMENVVEIHCHGGIISVTRIMDLLLEQGVRLAEPGEFTKRAFLNGRLDLTQAEAVVDLIRAKSDRAFRIAMNQSEGKLSERIRRLRQELIETIAHIEVNIDYPEHDVEELTHLFITEKCSGVISNIDNLLKSAKQGKILREGITTVIVGRPNVGKSSLLNWLSQSNKAIVTDIPGTTRDVVEEFITLNGIPLRLLDTAGIRETSDVVEKIGVERSRLAIEDAELILFMLNAADPLHEDERNLLKQLNGRNLIVILNKVDLPQQYSVDDVLKLTPASELVEVSVVQDQGLNELEASISRLFVSGSMESQDMTYISNIRHIGLLNQAKAALQEAVEAVQIHIPIDMIQIDVRRGWEFLGEIIGEDIGDSLIDQIFSQFCLGK